MSQTYPVACVCGVVHRVTAGDSGSSLPCDCGKSVEVPSLGVLRVRAGKPLRVIGELHPDLEVVLRRAARRKRITTWIGAAAATCLFSQAVLWLRVYPSYQGFAVSWDDWLLIDIGLGWNKGIVLPLVLIVGLLLFALAALLSWALGHVVARFARGVLNLIRPELHPE